MVLFSRRLSHVRKSVFVVTTEEKKISRKNDNLMIPGEIQMHI